MDEESQWTENEYPEEYQKDDGSTGTRIVNRDAAGAYSWVDASPAAAPAAAAPTGPPDYGPTSGTWGENPLPDPAHQIPGRPGAYGFAQKNANGSTVYVNLDANGNWTAKPWQQPAAPPGQTAEAANFASWAQEFTMVHGREPEAKDYQDKVWMDEFVAKQGRFPTREEWVRNWYAKPRSQRNNAPEFVPFKSIGGPGGWQKDWGAPLEWKPGEDWNSAFERVGFAAQQAEPMNRANSLATQRLIGSSMNYADYQTKADAILSFLKQFEKPVETKAAEETAAAKGGPAGGGRPVVTAPPVVNKPPDYTNYGDYMSPPGTGLPSGVIGPPAPGMSVTPNIETEYNPAEPQFNPYSYRMPKPPPDMSGFNPYARQGVAQPSIVNPGTSALPAPPTQATGWAGYNPYAAQGITPPGIVNPGTSALNTQLPSWLPNPLDSLNTLAGRTQAQMPGANNPWPIINQGLPNPLESLAGIPAMQPPQWQTPNYQWPQLPNPMDSMSTLFGRSPSQWR